MASADKCHTTRRDAETKQLTDAVRYHLACETDEEVSGQRPYTSIST